jgi:hypothetical protein
MFSKSLDHGKNPTVHHEASVLLQVIPVAAVTALVLLPREDDSNEVSFALSGPYEVLTRSRDYRFLLMPRNGVLKTREASPAP